MPPHDDEQDTNIERVRSRIGPCVLEFTRERLRAGTPQFHADDLRNYVIQHGLTAPGSPDRILRDLRQRSQLGYVVTDRRQSLYCIEWVDAPPPSTRPGWTRSELIALSLI
jgi:hypothetical protein